MNKNYKVSVVVPTYNRKYALKECLESLLNQTYANKYEIIIVDDGSSDGTEEMIKTSYYKKFDNIKYIKQNNQGPASARNRGIDNANGEIICFIDDDCVADKDWVSNLTMGFNSEFICGIEGKILGYNSKTIIEKYGDYLFTRTEISNNNYIPEKDGPIICNASYRKNVLKLVNGFDPKFLFPSLEDLDIALRIRKKGYVFKYAPSAIVYHKHKVRLKELFSRAYKFSMYGSKLICDKHPAEFSLSRLIASNSIRICYKLVSYPYVIATMAFADDKLFYLLKPFLDILISFIRIGGLIMSIIFRIDYNDLK